jgi:glycosyltransferase involved in cell wall biosynthesis
MTEDSTGVPTISVVIPVFNSADIVDETVRRTLAFFHSFGAPFEVILVNDGSKDASWEIISNISDPAVVAIDLLRNYGQHTAVLAGLAQSVGDWVLTIDDDLQNPPEELEKLLAVALSGHHDLVVGRFDVKQHHWARRVGSRIIDSINRRIFNKPDDLVLTNVRCVHRSVVDRVCSHSTPYPYINGLTVLYSSSPTNVSIEHHERASGTSNYTPRRIATLVFRILFNYSSWPLRAVTNIGLVATLASFLVGGYALFRALLVGSTVPGWASMAVMLAFFNGVSLLLLSMLGEYTARLLQHVSQTSPYHMRRVVRHSGAADQSPQAKGRDR